MSTGKRNLAKERAREQRREQEFLEVRIREKSSAEGANKPTSKWMSKLHGTKNVFQT